MYVWKIATIKALQNIIRRIDKNPAQLETNVPAARGHSMGFVILISCAAGLGGLLYGYDTAVISVS